MKNNKYALTAGQIAYTAFSLLLFPGLILGVSGDFLWPEAWIFTVWFLGLSLVVIVYLAREDPALLQERLRKPGTGGQEGWDKVLVPFVVLLYLAWCVVMPLDAKRFHWFQSFPLWVEGLGALGLVPAAYFSYRAYLDNSFVSPLIRIQKERKQKVVSTGVYGFVRHPMYLGAILMMVCVPLLLNSKAGLALGSFLSLLICLRVLGEEKALLKGLKGYAAYRKKVKYRLVPGIW
jgi:protein-S-isoprenylcysteine O-methyltransferase Ste14